MSKLFFLDRCYGESFSLLIILLINSLCFGSVITVGPGQDHETIQEAIDAATEGDEIVVSPETYYENINFKGKNIILRSTEPLNPSIMDSTIIHGQSLGPTVTFQGDESSTCILSGFMITGGKSITGGGIFGQGTLATVSYNRITSNTTETGTSEQGGGLYNCDGLIAHNLISENSSRAGGGLAACGGRIEDNIISGNTATLEGGGIFYCPAIISNNLIINNTAQQGGGLFDISTCRNNTIYGNKAQMWGGLFNFSGTVKNCIIWNNTAESYAQVNVSAKPGFCCIQDWALGGAGNIAYDPRLADAENGDFHLMEDSPCIDAGAEISGLTEDFDGQPRPIDSYPLFRGDGSDFDMGADEFNGIIPVITPTPTPTPDCFISVPDDYSTIQGAIDAAHEGCEIVVSPGRYNENIFFKGKNIIVRSVRPSHPLFMEQTIIDGGQNGPVVAFSGTENSSCVLSGFTLINGKYMDGGGISGNGSKAAIRFNRIMQNETGDMGMGGGINQCHGMIHNCLISNNTAYNGGGGVFDCDGIIANNLILENNSGYGDGGGLLDCDGVIINNNIVNNNYSGLYNCSGLIVNCIIWDNDIEYSSTPFYSCIDHWSGGGKGNISSNPKFQSPSEPSYNTHLKPDSPCVDTGYPYYFPHLVFTSDLDGNCRTIGNSIDMGCYEFGFAPDGDGDFLSDADEATSGISADNPDADSDGLFDGLEILRGSNPLTADIPPGITIPESFASIQEGLFLAFPGEEIALSLGTYHENLFMMGKNVILQGIDPLNKDTVSSTILDGDNVFSTIMFEGSENETTRISGLTIKGGKAFRGGGINGRGSQAEICHNRIVSNTVLPIKTSLFASPIMDLQYSYGGGLYDCNGVIRNNDISGNSAQKSPAYIPGPISMIGGGLSHCNGNIRNNIIRNNTAESDGGGLSSCDGIIQNCLITNNSAQSGGAFSFCDGMIQNNTIVKNTAEFSSAFFYCDSFIANCIIRDNTDDYNLQLGMSIPFYSCLTNADQGHGRGNIYSENPGFVDPDHDIYELSGTSPCLDKGNTYYLLGNHISDLNGNCRIKGEAVDMGCCEFDSSPDQDGDLSSDLDETELETNPSNPDTDGDGLMDGVEALANTNPKIPDPPQTVSVPGDHSSIQEAMFLNVPYSEIVLEPGTYKENILFPGKDLSLRSTDFLKQQIVTSTTLDGENIYRVVTFVGTETSSCTLQGLTIKNGRANRGGGIKGNGSDATITHNHILSNIADTGGGIFGCNGLIRKNLVFNNSGGQNGGGGLSYCHGFITNNIISHNTAFFGGGINACIANIQKNIITFNTASYRGGGINAWSSWGGSLENNIICYNLVSGESVDGGGGVSNVNCSMTNNIIAYNKVEGNLGEGGGLLSCLGPLDNNTIYGNEAPQYGALDRTYHIENCIIWNNLASYNANSFVYYEIPLYCCIQNWPNEENGNISDDPGFMDPESGNFHLSMDSPCIDAGNPAEAHNDGCLPPGKNTVHNDMGAYGGPNNCDWIPEKVRKVLRSLLNLDVSPASENDVLDQNRDGLLDIADIIYYLLL